MTSLRILKGSLNNQMRSGYKLRLETEFKGKICDIDWQEYAKIYPQCYKLGVLELYPLWSNEAEDWEIHPRVNHEELSKALPKDQYDKWVTWYGCSTLDALGIYAWDVEDFLEGRANRD